MHRMASLRDFARYRDLLLDEARPDTPCLVLCADTGAQASGANDIMRVIKRAIIDRSLQDRLSLRVTGSLGFCEANPFLIVEPEGNLYPHLKMTDVPRIIDAVLEGRVVEDLLYKDQGSNRTYRRQEEIPFLARQTRTLLGRNQHIDPIRVRDYIRAGGYQAIAKVLATPDRQWVVEEITASGLRGRGGAGFPTGRKWELARGAGETGRPKYIVCNADEGDPGAYMDRALLESNPHAVLEGMLVGAAAIGATHGFIYVRSEYPLAIKHARIAIRQAGDLGLLGQDVLGTGLDLDIEVIRGAGAYVCGEETALIRSVEGHMPEPRQRPPYPIERGIDGCPTVINNVETLANVPVIINAGAAVFRKVGVPGNAGTKIFSLVGKIRNTGLVEVPMGTSIREIVYDIGGGAPGKGKVKAVQTGGPSGGCIPAHLFDLPIDYESLAKAGSMMGSGGMIVMDQRTCMVDVARYFMTFLKDESCGKCFTCRKGTQRMHELLDDITRGEGGEEKLGLLEELATTVKDTSMCGLGQTAANPVLSTLRYFREEYLDHVLRKRCPAGICKPLITYTINDACNGCGVCRRACSSGAIAGAKKELHTIDTAACNRCGACFEACRFDAVDVR